MKRLKSEEVFKPGLFPEYTYISRMSPEVMFSYEFRLEQALKTPGYLTSIIGPSKTGKTVLCEKVIGINNIVLDLCQYSKHIFSNFLYSFTSC